MKNRQRHNKKQIATKKSIKRITEKVKIFLEK